MAEPALRSHGNSREKKQRGSPPSKIVLTVLFTLLQDVCSSFPELSSVSKSSICRNCFRPILNYRVIIIFLCDSCSLFDCVFVLLFFAFAHIVELFNSIQEFYRMQASRVLKDVHRVEFR